MFPRHARRIMLDAKVRNLFDILTKLYDMGYKNVTMVVGADRVQEFDVLMNKYNGKKGRHGFYNFRSMNVASAGDRDPDAEGATGMSASKMRAAAGKGDFTSFSQGLPKTFSNADAKNLFNTVRKGMGLKEQREYKNHIQLNPISETREQYITGELYSVGDKVIVKESDEVGEVTHLGANYVIVEKNGSQKRYWLDAIELLEKMEVPQDRDIKDKEGTQPAKYYKGLSKSTKSARDAHFKKNTRQPAPGDKEASKKDMPKSQHTLKFKQMYGEQDAVKRVQARIKRRDARQDAKDEKQDKRDVRAIAQAKIRKIRTDVLKKNRETK